MTSKQYIAELLKPLKETGRFSSPEEVNTYFEESLEKAVQWGEEQKQEKIYKDASTIWKMQGGSSLLKLIERIRP